MRVKINPNVFTTPCGLMKSWGVTVFLDNGRIILREFFSKEEVEAFVKGVGGKYGK